jgi:hypothetical protein
VRYVLRRNPRRAEEMAASRAGKLSALEALCEKQNSYLAEHPQADPIVAWRKVLEKAERLGLGALVNVTCTERRVRIEVDAEYMAELAELDGCYALKTNLPSELADKQIIHDRYKDLSMVEWAFRTCKTTHLEVRPVFVRSEASGGGPNRLDSLIAKIS